MCQAGRCPDAQAGRCPDGQPGKRPGYHPPTCQSRQLIFALCSKGYLCMFHTRLLAACLAALLVSVPALPAMAQQEESGPPPFAKIVKDHKELSGLFTFYQRESDQRMLMEIKPEQLNKIYLMAMT